MFYIYFWEFHLFIITILFVPAYTTLIFTYLNNTMYFYFSLSHCTISFSIMHQVMGMKPLSLLYHIVCNHHLFQLPKWIFRPQVVTWLQKDNRMFDILFLYWKIRSPMIFIGYQLLLLQISHYLFFTKKTQLDEIYQLKTILTLKNKKRN